ncbi:protein translocase subunit SecF [Candidatus Uhrbacteria bacterium]|nr:protein translocase subunit SecF [Candidatus Uhrbacteria bacterium]
MKTTLVNLRPVWYAIAGILAIASFIMLGSWGLKQGIEFTGGTLLAVRFENRPSISDAESALRNAVSDLGSVVIQPAGEKDIQLRFKTVSEEQHQAVLTNLRERFGEVTELRYDAIGPSIGNEIRSKALSGLGIVLVAILIYIAYAFRGVSAPVESWKYGLVTIVASGFVVLVPLGLYAFLGYQFGTEIGTPFVAAILTIIGYSITDTIVVMDRIRENLQKASGTFKEIVEMSIRQTFVRSITNSMATLLTLLAIFFYGGDTLDEFTLPLIVGITIGTFASMLLASPMLVTLEMVSRKFKK